MNITIGSAIIYIVIFVTLYTTTLWLIIFLENKNNIFKKPKALKYYPFVSIIVPCFNEEETIIQTTRSLLNLNYPKNKLEIIIIDDGSTDKTYERAKTLLKHGQVKLFHKENGGKWTALNYGLEKSQGEFVGCLDADSFVAPNALKIIIPHFADKKIMAVTSSLKVYKPKNILQRVQRIEYILSIIHRKILAYLNSLTVIPGPFSIYRKIVFEKLGPFVPGHNTEDCEIAFRLQSQNYAIANAPNACVYTITPASLKALQNQRKRWGQGYVKNGWDYRYIFMNKKYKDLGLFVLPIIPLVVLGLMTIMFYTIFLFAQNIIDRFVAWQAIGFDINQITFNWNWFFINTSPPLFIGFFILISSITMFLFSIKISNEDNETNNKKNKEGLVAYIKDSFFFLFLYGPLSFIWWLAIIKTVLFNKDNKW